MGIKKPITKTLKVGEVTLVSVPKAAPIPGANGQSLGRIGYLEIPGIVGDDAAQKTYATQVQAAMRDLETAQSRCGWVVDLRRNRGGYTYAMLAGLGPLLNGGQTPASLGGQRSATGQEYLWHYADGALLVNETKTQSRTIDRFLSDLTVSPIRNSRYIGQSLNLGFSAMPRS